MTPYEYFKEILRMLPEMSKQTGYPLFYLGRRFVSLYLAHRVEIDEFRSLHLFDFTRRKSDEYLLWKESKRIADRLNTGCTKEEQDTFEDKHLFNAAMRGFIRRDWLYLPEASDGEIAAFLAKNGEFLIKPCVSTQGVGIEKCRAGEWTPETLREKYGGSFLMEAVIVQHPALSAVNPSSVNTIRYIAARHGDAVAPVGAGLRVGGSGQFVDNFHHGGVAYPLDLDSGIVTGAGIDLDGHPILRHPTTGHIMPGLQVPCWDEVTELVRRAAVVVPHIGYVGWDIAITPDGPELIEGNVHYPGNTVIQIDGPGPRRRLTEFLKSQGLG